jgi:hypothetical protein
MNATPPQSQGRDADIGPAASVENMSAQEGFQLEQPRNFLFYNVCRLSINSKEGTELAWDPNNEKNQRLYLFFRMNPIIVEFI